MDNAGKVRENRLRRMAKRQRLTLVKARRRDPRAWDFGTYGLIPQHGAAITSTERRNGLHLDEIEAILTGEDR
jgi:hypothetical protein